jgi:hypothetical protein
MKNIDPLTPIWKLTVEEFMEVCKELSSEGKYEYGLKGLAKLLGCSVSKASEIKSSGILNNAIIQRGNIIIINKEKALKEKKTEMVATIAKAKQKNIEKGRKPKKAKPPKHDVERQMREVGEILASKGKDFSNVTQDELNRELRNWHINEHYKNKTAKMTEEEQLIDLLFTK